MEILLARSEYESVVFEEHPEDTLAQLDLLKRDYALEVAEIDG